MTVNLRTDNFVLRELRNSDEENLLFLLNDSALKKHIPGLAFNYQGGIEQLIILSTLNNSLLLVIEDIFSKRVIGLIYLYVDINSCSSSLHYVMDSNNRGKGIMPTALKLLIEYLYKQKLVRTINICINTNLKSSLRVMKKLNIPIFEELDDRYIFKLSLAKELPF